ncbi:MAG: hypothetical protein AMJ93_14125 [Anaerolineae bacterium SM23_84]|nr:MAG: hypothetical protein AMJ93_14125 [Anaerolineae bacterium SM23_84]
MVRDWMRREGVTQYDLGKMAGISDATISRMLRGVSVPSWDTVNKLADVMGINEPTLKAALKASSPEREVKISQLIDLLDRLPERYFEMVFAQIRAAVQSLERSESVPASSQDTG